MRRRRISALFLTLTLVTSIVTINKINVQAKTKEEIQSEINSNKEKIEGLEEEKQKLNKVKNSEQNELNKLREELNGKNTLLMQSEEKVTEVQKQIEELQQSIDKVENEITKLENDIENNRIEIEKNKKEEERKREILGKRLRGVYKNNIGDQFLQVIIESDGIADLISNIANINTLVKTDNKLIDEIEEIQKQLSIKNSEMIKQQDSLKVNKDELVVQQEKIKESKKQYDEVVNQYSQQVYELKELEAKRKNAISSLTDEEKEVQEQIARYEEDNADLSNYFNNVSRSSMNNNSSNNTSDNNSDSNSKVPVTNGGFIRPSSGSITSSYGPRVHPITGEKKVHTGVDFGAPHGSPIKAAKGGIVTSATYHAAYGNMVIIDHGDGTSTLYAHASELNVSNGQRVQQGQIIAKVGSTGYSTGAHLHFEVRVNGQHVNPMKYIN